MTIINDIQDFDKYNIINAAVTVGKFDGFHRGHMLLINRILELKKDGYTAVVCMISQNRPGILDSSEKTAFLESIGIDCMVNLKFTDEFARQTPEQFVSAFLRDRLDAAKIVVGNDFRFGYKRMGDIVTLKGFERKYGYTSTFFEKLKDGDTVISSTEIRNALSEGDMAKAADMLGRPYSVSGTIVHGKHLGSTIGFPTINILPAADKLVPRYGVYISQVKIGSKQYKGITNIGEKPTVGGAPVSAETYIFDFNEDVYGKKAEVVPIRFLREEKRFGSVEMLREQLEKDMIRAREDY